MIGGEHRSGIVRSAIAILAVAAPLPVLAWDGTDTGTGSIVEIERGQTIRQGRDVEFFDYGLGSYRTLDIDSVRRSGSGVEIEGTDSGGGSVTLEMNGND